MEKKFTPCHVCGVTEFQTIDGYYFCVECGTQKENIVETAVEDEFSKEQRKTTKKIKPTEKNKLDLTSWECVNYILVGLVGELIDLGAMKELKLKVFQIWSEYLRKNQIAFFKKKKNQLPKLNACFKPRDAKIIYNHLLPKKKRSISKSTNGSSINLKTQRKKYATEEYEKTFSEKDVSLATLMNSSFSLSSTNTSQTHGLNLELKDSSRKLLKSVIPKKHLKCHERDVLKTMDCKCIPIKTGIVLYRHRTHELFNRKTVCAILYLALNLVGDDIQLCDLLRFMREGNLSSSKFEKFFPENIKDSYLEQKIESFDFPKTTQFSEISVRRQSAVICRLLSIDKINTPDLEKLTERFCKDFMLPNEMVLFVNRLIGFNRPEMKYISETTPFFEGRAFAYIIFVFKYLFGLDDIQEEIISQSAIKTNELLNNINNGRRLFVFTDWIKYIETRKVILSRYNLCYMDSYKDFKYLPSYLDKLLNLQYNDDNNIGLNRNHVLNMNQIFENFLDNSKRKTINYKFNFFTLTPQIDYFQKFISDPLNDIKILEILKFDHTSTEVKPFVNPKNLKECFKQYNINMQVFMLEENKNIKFVEKFSAYNRRPFTNYSAIRKIKHDNSGEKNNEEQKDYSKVFSNKFLRPVIKNKSKNEMSSKKKKYNTKEFQQNLRIYNNIASLNRTVPDNVDDVFSDLSDDNYLTSDDDDNEGIKRFKFPMCNQFYWTLHGKLDIKDEDFDRVKQHMPRNFLWLLETFASYLETDIQPLYHELMVLENQFLYMMDDDFVSPTNIYQNYKPEKKNVQFGKYFSKFW